MGMKIAERLWSKADKITKGLVVAGSICFGGYVVKQVLEKYNKPRQNDDLALEPSPFVNILTGTEIKTVFVEQGLLPKGQVVRSNANLMMPLTCYKNKIIATSNNR